MLDLGFGLVNQVAWAHSISEIMQPFRELVKPNSKFLWTSELDKLFNDTKALIISKVEQGIQTFDTKRQTCIKCDWSKDGIGYVVLQQYCQCGTASAPTCCPNEWQLTFAESRFTTPTEKQYSPTEGEALAVAWGLNSAKMFVLCCQDLIVITDHKPLLSIFKGYLHYKKITPQNVSSEAQFKNFFIL